MKRLGIAVVFLAILFSATILFSAEPDASTPAVSAAKNWLGLVDAGKYSESWAQAAELFRNAVSQAQWEQSLAAVRKPLGALISREVLSAVPMKQLPGAPDGDYVVIQFKTSFSNKKETVETVTPMKEKDGSWRVSGYYIH